MDRNSLKLALAGLLILGVLSVLPSGRPPARDVALRYLPVVNPRANNAYLSPYHDVGLLACRADTAELVGIVVGVAFDGTRWFYTLGPLPSTTSVPTRVVRIGDESRAEYEIRSEQFGRLETVPATDYYTFAGGICPDRRP